MNTSLTVIPFNKTKYIWALAGSLVFVVLGFWLLSDPAKFAQNSGRTVGHIKGMAIAGIAFFGLCLAVSAYILGRSKPAIILDGEGIINNTGGSGGLKILWQDITGTAHLNITKSRLLLIYVARPEEYIGRGRSGFIRNILSSNHKSYQTPVVISLNDLKFREGQLEKIIRGELEKRNA